MPIPLHQTCPAPHPVGGKAEIKPTLAATSFPGGQSALWEGGGQGEDRGGGQGQETRLYTSAMAATRPLLRLGVTNETGDPKAPKGGIARSTGLRAQEVWVPAPGIP